MIVSFTLRINMIFNRRKKKGLEGITPKTKNSTRDVFVNNYVENGMVIKLLNAFQIEECKRESIEAMRG